MFYFITFDIQCYGSKLSLKLVYLLTRIFRLSVTAVRNIYYTSKLEFTIFTYQKSFNYILQILHVLIIIRISCNETMFNITSS